MFHFFFLHMTETSKSSCCHALTRNNVYQKDSRNGHFVFNVSMSYAITDLSPWSLVPSCFYSILFLSLNTDGNQLMAADNVDDVAVVVVVVHNELTSSRYQVDCHRKPVLQWYLTHALSRFLV